jgi:hypothetical protein
VHFFRVFQALFESLIAHFSPLRDML